MNLPEGWKLVPVEPTVEMRRAVTGEDIGSIYRAMLDAAPTLPAQELEGKVYQFYEWDRWNDCSEAAFRDYKDDGMKARILYIYSDTPTPQYMEEQPAGMIIPCDEPPAQEDEPVYLCRRPDEDHWVEIEEKDVEFHERLGWIVRPLYTCPNNDKLRKAAEEACKWEGKSTPEIRMALINLRGALEKKCSSRLKR